MAGRRLIAVAAAVLLLHAVALDWLAGELDYSVVLRPVADPMFTRLLKPEAAPPPVVAAQAPARRRAPPPDVIATSSLPSPAAPASAPQPATPTPPAPVFDPAQAEAMAQLAASEAAPPAPAPEPPARPAESAAGDAATADAAASLDATPQPWLAGWPADTRLTYRLGGRFRSGELYGDAKVQWQREGLDYQVRVEVDITMLAHLVMTSQGEVTPAGLFPRAYEELRRSKRRAARFGDHALELEGGRSRPRPEGLQDTASQFVELAHRFASGREPLEVGRSVSFWMARPGAVDRWTYDIVGRETLHSATLGPIEAFHLKPRPIANPRGKITVEMWYSPSVQHLPVRILVSMGDEAQVDLMVEKIEQ